MIVLIRRLTLVVLIAAVAVLFVTSLPTWWGGHLLGYRLLVHMMASGAVVVGLPVYAVLRWTQWRSVPSPSLPQVVTFWALVLTGFLTIASMFACMLPTTSTPWMITLIDFHGWIGSTMAIVAILHVLTCCSRKAPAA